MLTAPSRAELIPVPRKPHYDKVCRDKAKYCQSTTAPQKSAHKRPL